jgi:hypothetical protein
MVQQTTTSISEALAHLMCIELRMKKIMKPNMRWPATQANTSKSHNTDSIQSWKSPQI